MKNFMYKLIQRGKPGVIGGGEKKYYAIPSYQGEATIDTLSKSIERFSTLSRTDIRAVLTAFVDVMEDHLAVGQIVRLDELGSLKVHISSEGVEEADKFTANNIKKAKIHFTPGLRLQNMLKIMKYKKAE